MAAPSTMNAARSVLVLVDYQARLMPAIHDAADVLASAGLLADAAHALGVPVIGTVQNPQGLGGLVDGIAARCRAVVTKMHFDACEDGLAVALSSLPATQAGAGPADVVVAGCETHVCVLQTVLGLLQRGHRTWVVAPACGSRRDADRQAALQRLQAAGATVVTDEMVVFEWLGTCEHPAFRSVLALIKQRGRAR